MLLNNSISLLPMVGVLLCTSEVAAWSSLRALSWHGWALLAASCVNAVVAVVVFLGMYTLRMIVVWWYTLRGGNAVVETPQKRRKVYLGNGVLA